MKIMSLNIWGGCRKQLLLDFLRRYQDVDIFCFQEVYKEAEEKISTDDEQPSLDIFHDIEETLPSHTGYFCEVVSGIYGLAIFVRKSLFVVDNGDILIHKNEHYVGKGPTHCRKLQWLTMQYADEDYTLFNVHGLWNGKGKSDSPERIKQSQVIKFFSDKCTHKKIILGDFNLLPETESLAIVAEGLVNQIEKHRITSTRTRFYPSNKPSRYADYVFTSPNINLNAFTVLNSDEDVCSDHVALLMSLR